MAQGVMIIAEQRDGDIRKISYELASEGKRLADASGQELTAVLLGSNIKDKAAVLGKYGAKKVIVADDPRLEKYTTDAYALVVSQIVKAADPAILLLGASSQGKDLAGRLAAKLDVGMAQDCIKFAVEGGK
ncbi:MAG: electron transfer flavoprotein subunit alpha/FixB family protein, partial [Deltaproteobacteria bacterium]|nr:electron transfer flavoprotein subunit alpha/FixB family protein [Deltaproteobacteria bacterium]